ncbi:SDR family NAD(P)-dependent oxidoreductase [Nonomuraea sp. NPDC050790]|uniref:SDR family NAD(P)-dependent oxidoreductase n=1 Tax=Nonomuraea sp. NPDC050790 TaxID=3364371 RepID=UPI00379F8643
MDLGLDGAVVLVTGASGAIGRAIARAYAQEGARVAAGWYGNEEPAREAAGEKGMTVRIDQSDPASMAAAVREVMRTLGPVAVLVANAVSWPSRAPETWESLAEGFTVNAVGTLTLVDAVLPGMREAGWGRVVIISSDVVDQPVPAGFVYPAAKGALETAVNVLALREAPHGILTNVVRPGFTLTERALSTPGFGREAVDSESAKTPTGRICTPEDVASAVVYLGSAANGHANGETLSVAGGRHLVR